jgi:hypothetical protein
MHIQTEENVKRVTKPAQKNAKNTNIERMQARATKGANPGMKKLLQMG